MVLCYHIIIVIRITIYHQYCNTLLHNTNFFEVAIILHVQYTASSNTYVNHNVAISPNMNNTNSTILCVDVYCNEKVTTNAALRLPYVL